MFFTFPHRLNIVLISRSKFDVAQNKILFCFEFSVIFSTSRAAAFATDCVFLRNWFFTRLLKAQKKSFIDFPQATNVELIINFFSICLTSLAWNKGRSIEKCILIYWFLSRTVKESFWSFLFFPCFFESCAYPFQCSCDACVDASDMSKQRNEKKKRNCFGNNMSSHSSVDWWKAVCLVLGCDV